MNSCCCKKEITTNSFFRFARNSDPTRTFILRKKFEKELLRRFKKLIKIINDEIVEKDAFGLKVKTNQRFAFPKDADKVQAFMSWLEEAEQREILETFRIFGIKKYANESWMNIYIRAAYQRGIARARTEMSKVGIDFIKGPIEVAFNKPFHTDAVALLYTRAFSELKGITAEMDKQISRVLAEGFVRGDNPLKIANDITNRVKKIGITRARVLARTEVIRAHHEANMNEYEQANVQGLTILAEVLTAGDNKVCPICLAWEKRTKKTPLTIKEARGLIPFHPQCRCVMVPFTKLFRDIKDRLKKEKKK